MSTQKNVRNESSGERSLQQHALTIVQRFNDPSIPISTNDFRRLIFRALHDAYNHHETSLIRPDELDSMYYLWEILDEVDAYFYLKKLD